MKNRKPCVGEPSGPAEVLVGGQVALGSGNVQIRDVWGSHIEVAVAGGEKRRIPLEPAIVPVGKHARSPALLVRARSGVVPFTARAGLADELEAWLTAGQAFSGLVVGGRGGSGKTRLAVELCERARRDGWPLAGPLARIADQSALDALINTELPRLVVIDYAETRAEQLEVLLPELAAGATEDAPVRVLMLIRASPQRTSDWAARLRNRSDWLDTVLDECEAYALEDEPLDLRERERLFGAASEAFAQRAGLPLPTRASATPSVFNGEAFATPLMLVIAAYLEVHEQADFPTTRDDLFNAILNHEERYWRSTSEGLFRPASNLPRRVAALATVSASETSASAAARLRLLPQLADAPAERLDEISEWAHELYPGPGWWNPLEPDRIAEHLIAATFEGEPEILGSLLAADEPEQITWPLTILSRAAADHPLLNDSLRPILAASLQHLCELAVKQASKATARGLVYGEAATVAGAIENAITTTPIDPDVLPWSVGLMPAQANLLLTSLAVTLARRHVQRRRELAEADAGHEPGLAIALNNFSVYLANDGQREQALKVSGEAVEIRRRLAAANPAAYEPNLAASLNNLANHLSEAGQREQALKAIEEAVEIYKRLAAANPAAHEPNLASSLNNLAVLLSAAGQREQGLKAIEEAVEIYKRLAAANPAAHEPNLASSLNTLANRLSEAGRREQALEVIEEAVEIRRRLAAANPAAYERDLATSLHNLPIHLADAGQREQGLKAIEEAVEIYKRLAAANPAAYELNLANSLNDLAILLSAAGQREQALKASEEAVEIHKRLAAANPAAHERDLAGSLNNLASRLSDAGQREQGLQAIEEAIEIHKQLAAANPAAHEPDLASSLNNLAVLLSAAGQREQALKASEEAVEIHKRLAAANPAAHEPNLATSLNNLAGHLSEAGQREQALEAAREASEIYKQFPAAGLC